MISYNHANNLPSTNAAIIVNGGELSFYGRVNQFDTGLELHGGNAYLYDGSSITLGTNAAGSAFNFVSGSTANVYMYGGSIVTGNGTSIRFDPPASSTAKFTFIGGTIEGNGVGLTADNFIHYLKDFEG